MCKTSGGSGGGGNSTTTSQTTGPPANVLQNYQDVYNQAKGTYFTGAGSQPYPGQTVAPLDYNQNLAISGVGTDPWSAYKNSAVNLYGDATQPIWSPDLANAYD